MITLTDKAAEKIHQILKNEHKENYALRIAVKGGGCSGFTYTLDLADSFSETDQVFEDNGVKIAIDAKSYIFLNGTEIDYTENLSGSGFSFSNPNANRTCGCGSSFQA